MCDVNSVKSILASSAWLRLHDRLEDFPGQAERLRRILLKSCKVLANRYLYIQNNKIYCYEQYFEEWQDLITQISPIQLFAALLLDRYPHSHNPKNRLHHNVVKESLLHDWLQWSPLPSCFPLDSYNFSNMNLHINDVHVHFSGILQADMAWQRCLADIPTVCRTLRQQGPLPDVFIREGINTVWDICHRLYLARWLQETLSLLVADETLLPEDLKTERHHRERLPWEAWKLLCQLDHSCDTWFDAYFARRKNHPELGRPLFFEGDGVAHPLSQCEHYSPFWPGSLDTPSEYLVNEGVLWLRSFQSSNPLVPCMLHCYSLLYAKFRRIAVYQPNMTGFSAFHDHTRCGLTRAHTLLQQHFMQLYNMDGKPFNTLDCRFSPKNSKWDNIKAYNTYIAAVYGKEPVMSGFRRLQSPGQLPFYMIQLRPHFHKKKDVSGPTGSHHLGITPISCRHAKLRRKVAKQAKALLIQEKSRPYMLLYGKDAAGNEEFCPPEVFAPAFRLLTKYGGPWSTLSHTSYHVGEVFPDVTTGLRAVDETLAFLNLQPDDSIGHGTSLGIDPAWWRERTPRLTLQKGVLLDNYVWIWGIWQELDIRLRKRTLGEHMWVNLDADYLRRTFLNEEVKEALTSKIFNLFSEIYINILPDPSYDAKCVASLLYRAWKMRNLDPLLLNESLMSHMTQWEQEEISLIKNASKDIDAFNIFTAYHTNSYVRENYSKTVEIDMGYIPDGIINILQDYLILKINEKNVKIEVMPTANKRIAGYKNYSDHPVIRWLCRDSQNFRPSPSIVIGTDNPGLFSTNIYNEFALLRIAFKEQYPGKCPDWSIL